MERRIFLAPAFALATLAVIASAIGACGLEEYGLPLLDASALDDGSASDGATTGDSTTDDATTGSDAIDSADGPTDGGAGESSPGDGGTIACDSGFSCGVLGCLSDCQGCVGSPLACATTGKCESSCSACPSHSVECYLCDSGLPVGRCDTTSASECLGAGYQHCSCAIVPCLSLVQVCVDDSAHGIHNECRTCGENETDGGGCGIFQHCNPSTGACN